MCQTMQERVHSFAETSGGDDAPSVGLSSRTETRCLYFESDYIRVPSLAESDSPIFTDES